MNVVEQQQVRILGEIIKPREIARPRCAAELGDEIIGSQSRARVRSSSTI